MSINVLLLVSFQIRGCLRMSFGFGFLPKLVFHRGPYTSAHVLLNLINELWEGNKIRGLPIVLSLFRNEF